MVLPHYKPIYIRGFTGKSSDRKHPGLDTIPATSGFWPGITQRQKDVQISKRLNTDIVSCLPGIIIWAAPISGAGNTVAVSSLTEEGLFTFIYCHLNSIEVSEGIQVEEGAVLGKMGYSGVDINNIHLHLTVTKDTPPDIEVPQMFSCDYLYDPMNFFSMSFVSREGAYELKVK